MFIAMCVFYKLKVHCEIIYLPNFLYVFRDSECPRVNVCLRVWPYGARDMCRGRTVTACRKGFRKRLIKICRACKFVCWSNVESSASTSDRGDWQVWLQIYVFLYSQTKKHLYNSLHGCGHLRIIMFSKSI